MVYQYIHRERYNTNTGLIERYNPVTQTWENEAGGSSGVLAQAKVHTYEFTTTPTGSYQLTDFVLNDRVILMLVLTTTIPEVTGSNKQLNFDDQDGNWAPVTIGADLEGTNYATVSDTFPSTTPDAKLRYAAGGNDWAEYRGVLKIIYIDVADL